MKGCRFVRQPQKKLKKIFWENKAKIYKTPYVN